jgi:hypothetical protein
MPKIIRPAPLPPLPTSEAPCQFVQIEAEHCTLTDNLNIHEMKRVRELIAAAGATAVYLPTYSPELIEAACDGAAAFIPRADEVRVRVARRCFALGLTLSDAVEVGLEIRNRNLTQCLRIRPAVGALTSAGGGVRGRGQ